MMNTSAIEPIPGPENGPKDSATADFTCLSRAMANREGDPRFRGPDYLAKIFVTPRKKFVLALPGAWKLYKRLRTPKGGYEFVFARTRFMDQVFVNALEEAFEQIVILGAGFDTRALRFQHQNQGTTIFELDRPSVQAPKIEVYQRKGMTLPKELIFLSIDFKNQSLEDILLSGGFQPGKKNLFIWEGVTMYLTAEVVEQVLGIIHRLSARESQVAFDFIFPLAGTPENSTRRKKNIGPKETNFGKKKVFCLEERRLVPFLTERGFATLSVLPPAEIERLYLTVEDGTLIGHTTERFCLALAAVQ